MQNKVTPFYIVGPTGSGKSSIALALAERWDGEIVNADAFQLYARMPIITAAPGTEERERAGHHLYGVVPIEETCHVARYVEAAQRAIAEIQDRGRRPIIVGGSGLYVKALTHGLSELPPGDAGLRQALATLSEEQRVAWLAKLDPEGARRMNLRNPRYVMRALEMTLLSGEPASVMKAQWERCDDPPDIEGIVLCWDRETLYARINRRVEAMIASGAVDEVARLPKSISQTASKAIGVRELQRHLRGEWTLAEAVAGIQQASRRYAKRQETWFRREKIFRRMTWSEAHALVSV